MEFLLFPVKVTQDSGRDETNIFSEWSKHSKTG